jgi:hypothetical protein
MPEKNKNIKDIMKNKKSKPKNHKILKILIYIIIDFIIIHIFLCFCDKYELDLDASISSRKGNKKKKKH